MSATIEKYGRFIEEERCFKLVKTPPRKWINQHFNKIGKHEIYAECTNIGDGHTWVRDEKGNTCKLIDWDSKYLYIRDDENNMVFSPGGQPAPRDVEDFSCSYYAEKTVIQSRCQGLHAKQRFFCPPLDDPMEIWTVEIKNESNKNRKVSVFAFALFDLGGLDTEGKDLGKDNFSQVLPELGGVLVTNRNQLLPSERFKAYMMALDGFYAAEGYRDNFTRSDFALSTPRLLWGDDLQNNEGYGPDCCGAVQVKFKLEPGETKRIDFIAGQCSGKEDAMRIRKSLSPAEIDKLCEKQKQLEEKRQDSVLVKTGNPNYDALINFFVKKQVYSYLINKSGFRDNLQTDWTLAMFDYPAAKDNLLRALASQKPDGSVIHGFRPINRLQYSDKPSWIAMVVCALIKESGDFSLLDQKVPYFESEESGTVLDHLLRAMRFLANDTGKYGLCLQHHADWNDGLEATAQTGERESIMVTQQFCYGLLETIELAKKIDRQDIEKEASELHAEFTKRLNEKAWDGEWFVRTLCEDGYAIGSSSSQEGSIFLNPQSWAVISKTASKERQEQAMQSADKMCAIDIGYRICSPSFSQYDPRVGQMSNSMPGFAENGGCYNHAAGFKAVADCMLGRAEEAWETFRKVSPDNPQNPVGRSQMEPFSYVNMFAQVPCIYGKAGYPWRTGTAVWFSQVLIEWILGARRSYDGLLIDPCLSKELKNVSLKRTFRGIIYNINIDNSAGRSKGISKITVDGKEIQGTILPLFDAGSEHQVDVVL